MKSLFSGVSGLRVHQTKMDVISNNIANINTVGFKRSTATFKDSFSQTLTAASAANADRGGVNPQQIGAGASIGAISTVMSQGAQQRTDDGNNIYIDGDGFFIVKDATGFSFTRAGNFEVDASGNLVNPSGLNVCGWKVGEDGKIVQDRVEPINIYEGNNLYSPATATTNIEFTGNFNLTTNPEQKNTMSFYDSLGNKYNLEITFKYNPENQRWTMESSNEVIMNGKDKFTLNNPLTGIEIGFGENGKLDLASCTGLAETDGKLTLAQPFTPELAANAGPPVGPQPPNSNFGEIVVDFTTLTQFNSKPTVTADGNGNTAGNMNGYSIDGEGIIRASYDNGESKIIAQIPLAKFKNPAGLEKYGSNLYKETANSGEFDGIGATASSLGSSLQGGVLEMSNVDLSYEFSEMIITQRGFQANSRIITTSDEIIQELVNLKR